MNQVSYHLHFSSTSFLLCQVLYFTNNGPKCGLCSAILKWIFTLENINLQTSFFWIFIISGQHQWPSDVILSIPVLYVTTPTENQYQFLSRNQNVSRILYMGWLWETSHYPAHLSEIKPKCELQINTAVLNVLLNH